MNIKTILKTTLVIASSGFIGFAIGRMTSKTDTKAICDQVRERFNKQ